MATTTANAAIPDTSALSISGLVYASITFTCWGMAGVWIRLLHYPALFTGGLRMSVALLGVLPAILLDGARRRSVLASLRNRESWFLAAALTAYYLLAVIAFQYGSVAEVSLFIGTSPAFVLLTKTLRRIAIERNEKIGATLAAAGVLIVLGPKILSGAQGMSLAHLAGDVIGLCAASVSAFYAGRFRALHEGGKASPDTMAVALLCFSFGGFSLLGISQLLHPVALGSLLEPHNLWVTLVLGLLSTSLPSITYALAARKLPAIISTTSQLMIPVVGSIGAAILLRELPSFWILPGGVLIVYGILYMFRQQTSPVGDGEEPLAD
jgi:drug/metabolite transporter (DMT)-like permease